MGGMRREWGARGRRRMGAKAAWQLHRAGQREAEAAADSSRLTGIERRRASPPASPMSAWVLGFEKEKVRGVRAWRRLGGHGQRASVWASRPRRPRDVGGRCWVAGRACWACWACDAGEHDVDGTATQHLRVASGAHCSIGVGRSTIWAFGRGSNTSASRGATRKRATARAAMARSQGWKPRAAAEDRADTGQAQGRARSPWGRRPHRGPDLAAPQGDHAQN